MKEHMGEGGNEAPLCWRKAITLNHRLGQNGFKLYSKTLPPSICLIFWCDNLIIAQFLHENFVSLHFLTQT